MRKKNGGFGMKKKLIVALNAVVLIACIFVGIIGYLRAASNVEKSLQVKAAGDVKAFSAILEARYPGEWQVRNGILFKGETRIDKKITESLSEILDGQIAIYSGEYQAATTIRDSTHNKLAAAARENVLVHGKSYENVLDIFGEDYYCAYQPIKSGNGSTVGAVMVGVDAHELDGLGRGFVITMILIISGVMIMSAFASNTILEDTVGQLEEITGAMRQIASGNLRGDNLISKTRDEVGILAENINDMKTKLKHVLTNMTHSSAEIATCGDKLTAGTGQTNDTIMTVVENMDVLAKGTVEQEQTIGTLEEKFNEMGGKMDALSQTVLQMQQKAMDSASSAALGKEKVDATIEVMKTITDQVSSSAKIVGELGKRSDEIGEIVSTISGIAGQTNLLALNAAIEAARAGEQGKGFAVVADEVRKLAEQSSDAANSIAELITTIQGDTTEAVDSIERGNERVREGTQSVMETSEAFGGIREQSERLTANVEKSLMDIGAVFVSNEEISAALKRVREIAGKSSENATLISRATREQSSVMKEISKTSQTLAELSDKMQGEVSQFKL